VGPGFIFAVKGSRYITHMLRLRRFQPALANFFASGVLRLGAQLGPILWQLPPTLPFDGPVAAAFLAALPCSVREAERQAHRHDARTTGRAALTAPDGRQAPLRHALEARHPSWLSQEALDLLRAHEVALVTADTPEPALCSLARTAGFAYLRLHGSRALYSSRYSDDELAAWAAIVQDAASAGSDVFVYFDNDAHAHAPRDALRLLSLLRQNGSHFLTPSKGTTPHFREH
jgi:uncharacterized protein YecE (DUF72 family)